MRAEFNLAADSLGSSNSASDRRVRKLAAVDIRLILLTPICGEAREYASSEKRRKKQHHRSWLVNIAQQAGRQWLKRR